MSSKNQAFKELAAKAANFERNGDGDFAYNCWLKALEYSNNDDNREWCKARAQFCQAMRWHRQ